MNGKESKSFTFFKREKAAQKQVQQSNLKKPKPAFKAMTDEEWVKPDELIDDRYKVVKFIAKGGFAQVYEAIDLNYNSKPVAIKVIRLDVTNNRNFLANQRKSLDTEKEAFAKLSFSENVVGLHGFDFWQDKYFYITLDLIDDGKTLATKFNKAYANILSLEEFKYYYTQICKGLYEIHKAGIYHRDVKPNNVMITSDDVVKISDFGISRLSSLILNENSANARQEGTPKYIAPEQIIHKDKYAIQSDIYSIGIMMYNSLTGVDPYTLYLSPSRSMEQKQRALIALHISEVPEKPSAYNPRLPMILDYIVMKCMAKDLKYRYKNFKEVLADLALIDQNWNVKYPDIQQSLKDKNSIKLVAMNKSSKYKNFFSKFNWKSYAMFFTSLSILVIVLLILIFNN